MFGRKTTKNIFAIFAEAPLPMKLVPAIGICPAEKNTAVSFLCDWAIFALRSIKRNYFQHVAVFNDSVRGKMLEEQELLGIAEQALSDGEFKLYFQPKCNMNNGKIAGAEVLVRWWHPKKGMIMPGVFIPLFEKNGFIEKLDTHIWEKTVQWLKTRIASGENVVPISVNISRTDITNMDVYLVLTGLVEKYAVNPQLLELEITESAYIDKSEEIINLSAKLMDYGFIVLIDDFGSGYSSLNILKDIKANILKLDMRFLETENKKGKDIIQAVVYMGRWLNMIIITEGVEKQEQVDFLRKIGCTYAQGFFYHRPMEQSAFEELIGNPKSIDYAINNYLSDDNYMPIDISALIQENVLGSQLLEKIMGALAIYSYKDDKLHLQQTNEEYGRIIQDKGLGKNAETDIIHFLDKRTQEKIKQNMKKVLLENVPVDMIAALEKRDKSRYWFKIRLFTVAELYRRSFFYMSIFDVTESMGKFFDND
ncbi:EAL domain-containing protein [Pectinatus haikarae]|nr:EAL domain-containing protein [Pectinatus haikarae]